ncbi:MAG: hypothetical protein K2O08_04330 [Clostridia bacterium]|nr:hypothetical protein [Clostridia bacterium]
MKIFFLKILMWLQIGLSRIVDMVMQLFSVFSGIDTIKVDGKEESLLLYFIGNTTVIKVFWAILIIGVFCVFIFTAIAIIKNMVVIKKTVSQILGKMLISMFSMIVVVICLFGFIFGANCVLTEIDVAFNQGSELTIGQQLFDASITDAAWVNPDFAIKDEDGISQGMKEVFGTDNKGKINKDWDGVTPDKIFGTYKTDWMFENIEKPNEDQIVNIEKYDFFIGLPSSIIMAIVLFIAVMGLVTRLYDLVFIFLTSPLIMSTLPVDDGAKFKLWRETAISKTLLAYGTVFSVNIYIILMPLISKITIPGSNALTTLMRVLLIICGALTISNGQVFFARLLGTDAQESRQAAYGMRTMFAGVMGSARAVKGAARMTFGQYNAYTGHRERGLIQGTGKVLGAAGTVLTGGFKDKAGNTLGFGNAVGSKMGQM